MKTFRRRRERSTFGDVRRCWLREDRLVKVTESKGIDGIALDTRYHVIRLTPDNVCRESLVSRHRVLNAALRAAGRVRG